MIDLETLGTNTDSVIIAIGACKFDLTAGTIDDEGFYASVSIESNLAIGRTISESTLMWWMQQSPEARRVFGEEKVPLVAALEDFETWLGGKKLRPWGNGPTFDLGKVAHAFHQHGWEAPWDYWDERCCRTYRALPGAKTVPRPAPAIAHHALHDAVAQAQWMIDIHKAVFVEGRARSSMVRS